MGARPCRPETGHVFLDWGSITSYYGLLLQGAWLTIVITLASFTLAAIVGVLVAAARASAVAPLRWLATVYVEVLRNTPVLLQIFIVFYGFPSFGIRMTAITAGILGLGFNVGAYLAEIFRAGINAVPRGHREAATALGITPLQSFIWIVAPVALSKVFPAVTNMFIATLLGSSLLSVIAVPELTGQTNEISARTFLTIEVYSFSTGLYLVLTLGSALILGMLGRRLFPARARG
ncbi:MAG: rane protein [Xanthobacteraceae bacterium]|nr:rane protein [Xanthobacteraceae bacterium]